MITKALSIDGWMNPAELQWLAEQAKQHNVIVEVGSYLGRSTRALGDNTLGKVFAIDDWYGPRDVILGAAEREYCYDNFYKNLKDLIDATKVIPVKLNHRKARELSIYADMVFIDGDHEYEGVKDDISIWWNPLQPGGLMCGHEYREF